MDEEIANEWLNLMTEFDVIQSLVDVGILGPELMPEANYWHWEILRPDELPENFKQFIPLGEVRW